MNIFTVIIISSLIGVSLQEKWSYADDSHWPGACLSGASQSPINIISSEALVDRHGVHIRGSLDLHGYHRVNVTAQNNGHSLKWTKVPETFAPYVTGGPLRSRYNFLQFHFHWLSEHAIDGVKYPLEIHMVHLKDGYTLEEALKRPDGLAVIAVMCEVVSVDKASDAFGQIMPAIASLTQQYATFDAKTIDLSRLLSPVTQSYYTYHGSLTTPECAEVVTWIVMDKVLSISDNQFKAISKVDIGGINNYRSLQPRQNRIVYRSAASCLANINSGLLAFLTSLATCSASSITVSAGKSLCSMVNWKRFMMGKTAIDCTK